MNTSESIFTKYELPLFFLLTYLLSWWIVPFLQGGMLAQGPAFAAVIIIALTAGRQGASRPLIPDRFPPADA